MNWQIAGLPAHPLVVHLAVVMAPLAAVALVSTGWRADWRRRYGPIVVALALIGALASLVAAQSGEALQEGVRRSAEAVGTTAQFGDHPEQGQLAEIAAFALAGMAIIVWATERWREYLPAPRWTPGAAYSLALAVSVIAIGAFVVAGHSGATLVWKDLGTFASRR